MRFLDLTQRAGLALNYLTRCVDRRQGCLPYFGCNIACAAGFLQHAPWDEGDVTSRFVEAHMLVRQLTGDESGRMVEDALKTAVERNIQAHGLLFRQARPWCQPHAWMFDQSRCMLALVEWGRHELERVRPLMQAMMAQMGAIALPQDDYLYLPAENWTGSEWGTDILGHPPTGLHIEALVDWFLVAQDEKALDLAGQFVRGVLKRGPLVFAADGALLPGAQHTTYTHIHSRLAILLGLAKYAHVTADRTLLAFVRLAFERVLSLGSSFGWIPESIENGCTGPWQRNINEICCTSDCINLLLVCASLGCPGNYDTIERFAYNQLARQQNVSLQPLARYARFDDTRGEDEERSFVDVGQRLIGGFQGAVHPNDFVRRLDDGTHWIESSGCCSPAGAKAYWLLYQHAIEDAIGGETRINMLFPSESARVRLAPAAGRENVLRIDIKQPVSRLVIRQPNWSADLAVYTASRQRRVGWERRSHGLEIRDLQSGEALLVEVKPITSVTEESFANGQFRVSWHGPVVTDMEPKGEHLPIYSPNSPFEA